MTTTSIPLTNASVDAFNTSAANQAAAAEARRETTNAETQLSQTFDDFLRLLTTQLQNQDPISPIDSTEFTNQLVSFSQVEQQIATNEKFDQLIELQSAGGFGDAIGYLGQEVEVIGNQFQFNGDTVHLGYGMPEDIEVALIEIKNAGGAVVGIQEASTSFGRNELVWDGVGMDGEVVPDGTYTINIKATDAEGEPVDIPTFVRGRVNGVENVEGVNILLVDNVPVNLADILAVRAPEPAEAAPPADET